MMLSGLKSIVMWRFLGMCFLILIGRTIAAQSLNDFRSIGDGDWNNNGTWEQFNGSAWVPAVFAPQLADGRVTIRTGHIITMNADELVDEVVVDGTLVIDGFAPTLMEFPPFVVGDALTVNGTLELFGLIDLSASSVVRVHGKLIAYQGSSITGSSASNLFFEANSSYEHIYILAGANSVPLATWNISSTCRFSGGGSMSVPGNLNQSFGNVTFNLSGGSALNLNGQLQTVRGNLLIAATNTKAIRLGGATNYVLNVDGDFTRNGSGLFTWNTAAGVTNTINVLGSFNHINGTLSLNAGTLNLNIAENYSWNNGSFTAGIGTVNISFNGGTPQNFQNTTHNLFTGVVNASVASGSILDLGVSSIGGSSATFTLNSGATLRVGSDNSTGSIVNSTSLGNLRVGGARTFNTGSTIIYNGTGDQFLGSGHPSIAGITTIIDNDVRVVSSPFIINGDLVLNNGDLIIAGSSITFGGNVTPGPGVLVANALTSITINDVGSTADFGTLSLTNTSVIENLTIAGTTGRNVKLGSNLAVANLLTLSHGELELNGFTLNIQSGFNYAGGNLLGSATSGLNITSEGAGSLPASVPIDGGSLGTLTLSRMGATLNIPSNLTITNLNLLAGTITHTGLITMQSGGTISVETGILTNPVGATTTYNVSYVGAGDVNTANELPVSAAVLNNLTNLKVAPAIVTLSANATVNGDLVLSEGTFNGDNRVLTLHGNFISNANSIFSSGTVIFDGTTLISGDSIPQFGNLIVNASKSLAIEGNLQINVARDITINGTFEPNQSIVLLDSAFSQNISGSGAIDFYRLEIEKASQDVTIQTSVSIHDVLNIRTATTLHAGNEQLRLLSNASRTARVNPLITGANIDGTVIVQRYLPNTSNSRAYRYLTPQVINTNVADWKAEVPITGTFDDPSSDTGIISANPSMFYYDEAYTSGGSTLESRYRNYPASGTAAAAPLINGLGYALYVRSTSPIVLDSRGTLSQHQKIINVTAQTASGNDGWNLIGNPYPSPILWDKVSRSGGVDNAVYIPDNTNISGQGVGTFVTYVGGISIPEGFEGMIDSGQGFWVHETANGILTFNETDKIISSDSAAQIYRLKAESDLLRLIVTGASGRDEMVVRYLADATDIFDGQFDALKLTNANLNVFTKTSDGRNMAINTLGELGCQQSIPISMSKLKVGTHTFSSKGIDSFGSDVNIVLVDTENNLEIDLRDQSEYIFSVTSQNINSVDTRFKLQVDKNRILDNLIANTELVCSDKMSTSVTLSNTQSELEYKLVLGNNLESSNWKRGTGENLQFDIPVKGLSLGENAFKVFARNTCLSRELGIPLVINKFQQPQVPLVVDVLACQTNATILEAESNMEGEQYLWYHSANDDVPFEATENGSLRLSNLPLGITDYYVSVKNFTGCESERAKIMVLVTQFDSVYLEREGNTLISSYSSGNTWFYNNELLNGEVSNKLIISKSGNYKVLVSINGCSTYMESYEYVTKEGFSIFPNPTKDNTELYFDLNYPIVQIEIYTSSGGKVLSESIIDASKIKPYTIPMKELSPGVYLIKVKIGDRAYTQRIIKL